MSARVWLFGAVAAVASALTATPVRADEPAAKPAPYVLVVGAGEFKDKAIQPRPSADADAKALYDLLTDPKHLDVPAGRAVLLLSNPDPKRGAEVATHDAVVKAIDTAVSRTGKDDLLIVAFFGRGASVADKTCLFTTETVVKDRAKTAVVVSDLEPAFKKLKGQRVLLLLDVSYNGFDPGAEKVAEPSAELDFYKALSGSDDEDHSPRPPDRVIVFGSSPSQEPLAKGGSSLFAATLLDALRGAADKPPYNTGYEPDGLVTLGELSKYLEKEVANQARQVGQTVKEKEQAPEVIGDLSGDFVVTHNPAETDAVRKRLAKLAELEKAGTITEEVAKEGAGLLRRMPKLKAFQELRKGYQKLADGGSAEAFAAARKGIKEGLTLDRSAASEFARKVSAAVERVTENSIKDANAGELTAAAIKGLYRRLREPLPSEVEESLKTPKALTTARRTELLTAARLNLGKREDLDGDKDTDLTVRMMLLSLNDPYAAYTDKEGLRRNESSIRGEYSGIGVHIRRDAVRDGLLVTSPIKGSPALKAGLQAGDLITEIRRTVDPDGKPLPEGAPRTFSTKGMAPDEAVKIILGEPGTPVTVVVQREGEKEPRVVELKRGRVEVESVFGVKRKANNDWSYYVDEDYKIAYIHLSQFTQNTTRDLRRAVDDLKKSGLNGLVLDLRENPGGYLSSAVDISGLFVGREKVVTVRYRTARPEVYRGTRMGLSGFPMAVLVNGGSASASEIVAACLQDYGRAVVVGEKSYGKGSVQHMFKFEPTGGELKMTVARYYPPLGRNIDKLATEQDPSIKEWGVTPDQGFLVETSREERNELREVLRNLDVIPQPKAEKAFQDRQLDKAMDYLREQIKTVGKGPAKGSG
jgi:carboxyl-terminal processing protease